MALKRMEEKIIIYSRESGPYVMKDGVKINAGDEDPDPDKDLSCRHGMPTFPVKLGDGRKMLMMLLTVTLLTDNNCVEGETVRLCVVKDNYLIPLEIKDASVKVMASELGVREKLLLCNRCKAGCKGKHK